MNGESSGRLSVQELTAVIERLKAITEEPMAATNPAPFARTSESMLTMGHGFVPLDRPLYKLELGEFAAEPLDYLSMAVIYQNAKTVLESPVPTTKVFDTTAGRGSISSFHLNRDAANLNYSFACDSDVQALTKAQLQELVSGLVVLAWEPPTADVEAEQGEPAANGVIMLNGWLGASYFRPLTVNLDPLSLTINNIVTQLARLSAVAGIAWENKPQPLVNGEE